MRCVSHNGKSEPSVWRDGLAWSQAEDLGPVDQLFLAATFPSMFWTLLLLGYFCSVLGFSQTVKNLPAMEET